MDVESFRTTLAEKILLADVRSRGARHVSMAHAAVQHADALMALLSQSKKATDK